MPSEMTNNGMNAVKDDQRQSWRDVIRVHPAAEMSPLMSESELRELGEDIRQHGLREPIVITMDDEGKSDDPACYRLLDGRNRLDAMELVGIQFELKWGRARGRRWVGWQLIQPPDDPPLVGDNPICEELGDPYQFVISANIRRRHLTAEQKRELIGKLLQADPTKSDRAIAKVVKADNKTVAAVRAKKERREEIPHVKARTDTKGRKQPAKKQKAAEVKAAQPKPERKSDPTANTAKSWRVEVITKDSKRYGNGVRLSTEEEADAYRANAGLDLMRENAIIVTASEVIPSDDVPTAAMYRSERGRFKGRFKETLFFLHGTCGTLGWEEIATPASSEAQTLVAAWDNAGPEQQRDFLLARKVEIMKAQQQIDWAAHADIPPVAPAGAADDLDIPDYLRRAPKDAAVQ
jgi:hypothetical protein